MKLVHSSHPLIAEKLDSVGHGYHFLYFRQQNVLLSLRSVITSSTNISS